MIMRRPKRLPLKRTHGAPPYVLAVHRYDAAKGSGHPPVWHYTVCFTWPIWQPSMGWRLPFLCVAQDPRDYSEWGELSDRRDRRGCGDLISWSEVPADVQNHIIGRCNYPDEVRVAYPVWEANCEGKGAYLLAADHSYGYYGPPTGFSSMAKAEAWCKENGVCFTTLADAWVSIANKRFRQKNNLA